MRIGIVSDTHNNLRNVSQIVELFDRAGVDRVVHTGDITRPKTLELLARIEAPLVGVYGNNDRERDALQAVATRFGVRLADPPLDLSWHERRILVVHDPRDLDALLTPDHDLALHGHTHRYHLERRNGTLVFNPGECAGHLPGQNTVGVVDLEQLASQLLHF